jgi:hypothetical protein
MCESTTIVLIQQNDKYSYFKTRHNFTEMRLGGFHLRNIIYVLTAFCCVTLVRIGLSVPYVQSELLNTEQQHFTKPLRPRAKFAERATQITTKPILQYQSDADNLMITVKTSKIFHHTRVQLILQTWFELASDDVRLF